MLFTKVDLFHSSFTEERLYAERYTDAVAHPAVAPLLPLVYRGGFCSIPSTCGHLSTTRQGSD
jgi:hypothetical protein